jgi:hypothetical protein
MTPVRRHVAIALVVTLAAAVWPSTAAEGALYEEERPGLRAVFRGGPERITFLNLTVRTHCIARQRAPSGEVVTLPHPGSFQLRTPGVRTDPSTGEFALRDRGTSDVGSTYLRLEGKVRRTAVSGRVRFQSSSTFPEPDIIHESCTTGSLSDPFVRFRARRQP